MMDDEAKMMATAGLELVAEVRRLTEALAVMSNQCDECMQNNTNLILAIEANLDGETAKRVLNAAGYLTQ